MSDNSYVVEAIDRLTAAVAHLADTHERVGKLQARATMRGMANSLEEWSIEEVNVMWASTEKEPKA